MLSQINSATVGEQTNLAQLEALWQQIQHDLEAKKQRIVEEIGQYPHPIPACDAQFNGLLEDRAAILQELGEVQGILKRSLTTVEHLTLLKEIMRSSPFLGNEVKGKIQQMMPQTM
jgi:hypothetical protein